MATRQYRKFDEDFKQGAVQLVTQTGKPIAQVARELGINEGTLGNWLFDFRRAPSGFSLTIGGCAGCSATVLGVGSCPGS